MMLFMQLVDHLVDNIFLMPTFCLLKLPKNCQVAKQVRVQATVNHNASLIIFNTSYEKPRAPGRRLSTVLL